MFSNPLVVMNKSISQRSMVQYANVEEEIASWDVYVNSSREARMMYQLQHPNILGLVGLAFQPLRLLLELAPRGDLKHCLKEFKEQNMKLNRRTLKAVMLQVCSWQYHSMIISSNRCEQITAIVINTSVCLSVCLSVRPDCGRPELHSLQEYNLPRPQTQQRLGLGVSCPSIPVEA